VARLLCRALTDASDTISWWLIRDIESGRHGIIPSEYLDLD
jgi:hypothetical protein